VLIIAMILPRVLMLNGKDVLRISARFVKISGGGSFYVGLDNFERVAEFKTHTARASEKHNISSG
jgi:hypothetical protein